MLRELVAKATINLLASNLLLPPRLSQTLLSQLELRPEAVSLKTILRSEYRFYLSTPG